MTELERALANALIEERMSTLRAAYYCGIERDGKWMDLAMSDGEWLREQCGLDDPGWHDAEEVKRRMPGAAQKFVDSVIANQEDYLD
jgi:hypothetical protein